MSARTSPTTRSCAPVSPKGEPLEKGVQEASVAPVPAADFGPLDARFTGGESGLDQEELVEDQTPHRRPQGAPARSGNGPRGSRRADSGGCGDEDLGRQRVEDAARRVEGAVDERPHPAGLYALVDGVDGHEPAGVRAVRPRPGRPRSTSMLFATI